MDDYNRKEAISRLRYAQAGQAISPGLDGYGYQRERAPTDEEIAEAERRHKAFMRSHNRREALSHILALGRRYDNAEQAIEDAKIVAAWIGLEID